MPKRILISAGPTWVKIDDVRVISNLASGRTGLLLAQEAKKRGHAVTVLLGPGGHNYRAGKVRIRRFKYFGELYSLIKKELISKRYTAMIHAAAVSDYTVAKPRKGKIKSGLKNLTLRLKPAVKIANCIKKIAPGIFLVIFKLEEGVSKPALISRARGALIKTGADLVVANKLKPAYQAFILDKKYIYAQARTKSELARKLFAFIP